MGILGGRPRRTGANTFDKFRAPNEPVSPPTANELARRKLEALEDRIKAARQNEEVWDG